MNRIVYKLKWMKSTEESLQYLLYSPAQIQWQKYKEFCFAEIAKTDRNALPNGKSIEKVAKNEQGSPKLYLASLE